MAGKLRTAAGLAAAGWVTWRAFGPEPHPRFVGVQERPVRFPGRSVLVGQNEFFVREAGLPDAPPLVLIHGWVYDSLGTWHALVDRLAAGNRIVAIDHRNHGKSDRIRGRYSIDQAADEVAGVLDAVGLGRVPVVGYSMGGMIAQSLARRHPGRVERMVLAATAAFPMPQQRMLTRAAFAVGRGIGRLSGYEGARVSYEYLMRTGTFERRNARWLWSYLLDRDVNLYYEGGNAIWRFDARTWVGRLDHPALVIIPTRDQLIPPAAQYELASLLRHAEVVEIVGARHEANWTHAPEMAKAIEGFVR